MAAASGSVLLLGDPSAFAAALKTLINNPQFREAESLCPSLSTLHPLPSSPCNAKPAPGETSPADLESYAARSVPYSH
ncbi:hypothetical protein E2320_010186 [Naja naja]|nr:hypothetical protein E2320_010186 [Naja naja]